MPTHAQQLRNLEFRASLPADSLLLHSFQYEDALALPFHINATLLSKDFDLELAAAIGHDASLRVRGNTPTPRFFHGLIAEFALVGSHGRFAQYHALIVPRLWLLSRTSDCRIFQQKTIPEIVSGILNEHSVEHELALSARYKPWEYCVQYRETDLDFVLRLLEHEGICFFFEHAKDHHKLVLADSPAAHGPLPSAPTLRFHSSKDAAAHERIRQWVVSQQLQPTRLALNDFDFKGPAKDLRTDSAVARSHLHTGLEVYDYPGKFAARDEGERYAKVRLEEVQSQHHTIRADADVTALATGFTFTLNSHPRRDQNRAHLITSLRIDAKADDFESTSAPNPGHFRASFTAVPADIPFRPRRATQRPIIPGPQTAIVVGESSKEIDTDEHARVKVQFHWDRYGKRDQNSSCWIRVSQPWAGKGWGGIQIPRIGQEVIIDFLEGDPDRPILTGRVYNASSMPPVSGAGRDSSKGEVSPTNAVQAAMQMSMRSNSLGGSGGHNEITMHDGGGEEKLFIRAQKDEVHNVLHDRKDTVGNDEVRDVAHDRTRTVGNNEAITVVNDRTRKVGNNESITVSNNRDKSITGSESTSIGKNKTETIAITNTQTVGAANTVTVGAAHTHSVGGAYTLTVGGMSTTTVGLLATEFVGLTKTVTVGDKLEIVVGSSKLTMESSGKITLQGSDIVVLASGPAKIQAGATLDLDGAVIDLN